MPIPKTQTGEMPFLDHLEELRWRIIYSLGALVVGVGIGFLLTFKLDLIGWLQAPVLPYLRGQHLVYTHPGDTFSTIPSTRTWTDKAGQWKQRAARGF